MKINYFSYSLLSSKTANSIHAAKMADALHYNKSLKKFFFYKKKNINFQEYYNLKSNLNYKSYFFSPAPIFNIIDACITILRTSRNEVTYGRNIKVCLLHSLFGRKVILETHQPIKFFTPFERFLFFFLIKRKKLYIIICISRSLKKIIQKEINNKNVYINVLHDSANLNSQIITNKKISKKVKIGYTGSLYPGRGVELIIKLAKIMKDYNFYIAGGTKFEIEKLKIKSGKNVIFNGFLKQKEIEKFQANMDLLLAPYQKNTIVPGNRVTTSWMSPLKIFEYMSSGTPFIASNIKVLREVLINNYNCLLCEPENLLDWKNAILLILNKKRLNNKLIKNALNDFNKMYSWQIRAKKIIKIAKNIK